MQYYQVLRIFVGGIAFGASWGCSRYANEQLKSGPTLTLGKVDEVVFSVLRPDLANAVWYVLHVSWLYDILGLQYEP